MIQDTKTIFEQWTDDNLQAIAGNPEHADPGMLDEVRREIERRAKVEAEREKIEQAAAEARRKKALADEAAKAQKHLEARRAEMFTPDELLPEPRMHLSKQLETLARIHYSYGGHAEAFILDALAMATREGKTRELVEALRETEYPGRWSMTHAKEPRVIVYFNEIFPVNVKKQKAREVSPA